MIAVSLNKVSVTYISEPVFENLSWVIHDNKVVGFVGPNGSGKSTILKIIAGQIPIEAGNVIRQQNLSIGFLTQEPEMDLTNTVWNDVTAAHKELTDVEFELKLIEEQLGNPDVYNHLSKLSNLLDKQTSLLEKYTLLGGPGFEGHVRTILNNLGFTPNDFSLPIASLSGGQKKLVGLAKLLITKPDLLLLDEPDNHLDISGKDYLAKFIINYKGGVVLVSHDRYLLDLVAVEIADLDQGNINVYPGNYSEYVVEKQSRLVRQQQRYQAQQKEITRLEQSAKRLLTWGHVHDNEKFIKRGQNILKRLDRMDKIDRPLLDRQQMGLEIPGWRGSSKVLEIIGLAKGSDTEKNNSLNIGNRDHEPTILFSALDLTIWHGEKIGLVGPNGSGKSLLFQMILGNVLPDKGELIVGPNIKIGYYAQEHQTLEYNQTLINTIRMAAPLSESDAVAFLGRFLFDYDQARGRISNLSGGERSRLQMALLMLSDANFLLLDEPTNNLDIPSAEILEESLADFKGTILVISHDRYFLDRVVGKVIEINENELISHIGNYQQYIDSTRKQRSGK